MKIREMILAYSGMIFGKEDYWHPEMKASSNINGNEIADYYVDTRPKHIYPGKLDEEGIPLLEVEGKYMYNFVTVAQFALGNYDKYYDTKNEKYMEVVKKCCDWFLKEVNEIEPGYYGYFYEELHTEYPMDKKWISALAQGQVISVLARYYDYSRDEKYLEMAKKLLKAYSIKTENTGFLTYLNGGAFFEEYPSKPSSFVLNGFIFAIWGVLDLYIVSGDEQAKKIYEMSLMTLRKNIHLYNINWLGWSRYDLYGFKIKNITSIFYHKLHINQLLAMYRITGDEEYLKYSQKWEKGKKNIFKYFIATVYKVIFKISVKNDSVYVKSIST